MTIKLHYKEINNIMDDNINKDNDSIDNKIFFEKFQVSKILSQKLPRKHQFVPTIWRNIFFIPKLILKMPFTEILRINEPILAELRY